MKLLRGLTVLALVLAGCATVRRAEDAQKEVGPLADDAAALTNAAGNVAFPADAVFRLPDFVELALSNRPDVVQARIDFDDACLALAQVASDGPLVPKVNGSGGFTRNGARGRHFSLKGSSSYSAALSFDVLVYDFGRTDALEAEARENAASCAVKLLETEQNVFDEVSAAYFGVLRSDALLEAAYTNEFLYLQHYDEARAKFEVQEVKKLDVLKAAMDYEDARLATITCSNDVTSANAEFLRALGFEGASAMRYGLLPRSASPLSGGLCELERLNGCAEEIFARAREHAPALAYRRAKLRAASARVDYCVADLFPKLSLDATLAYAEPGWGFSWGWKAVQSIFEGFRKTTAVDRAVLAMRRCAEDVKNSEKELSAAVAKKLAARDSALARLNAARVQAHQAKENLDTVREVYGVGEASRLDYTEAVKKYSEVMGDRISCFYQVQAAVAAVFALTGESPVYVEEYVPAEGSPERK